MPRTLLTAFDYFGFGGCAVLGENHEEHRQGKG